MADLFDVYANHLNTVFDGGSSFSASQTFSTFASLTGASPPAAGNTAWFFFVNHDAGAFSLSMTLYNVVSTPGSESAIGAGSFTFTDGSSPGDTVTAAIYGTWTRAGGQNEFSGSLSNVWFNNNSGDTAFTGGGSFPSSVPMGFSDSPPWCGDIQMTSTGNWFGSGAFNTLDGDLSATIAAVPTPAAILLGMLGLTVAGVKLRRFA